MRSHWDFFFPSSWPWPCRSGCHTGMIPRHYCYTIPYDEFGNENYSAPWQARFHIIHHVIYTLMRNMNIYIYIIYIYTYYNICMYVDSLLAFAVEVEGHSVFCFALFLSHLTGRSSKRASHEAKWILLPAGELRRCGSRMPLWCHLGAQVHRLWLLVVLVPGYPWMLGNIKWQGPAVG